MPKRGAFALGLTAVALVLLLNFQTPSAAPSSSANPGIARTSNAAGSSGTSGSSGADGSSGTGGTGTATERRTVDGAVVSTRFGSVQVEVTLDGGTIVDVAALQLPSGDRRTNQISSYAEPILRTQALQVQSSTIDGISGATYTSDAYARSLQAALDTAGI